MSATIDFAALANVTDHRDAGLLDAIDRFTVLNDTTWALIRRAERHKADGRLYKRLWREALSTHEERDRLEQEIASTAARTRLGLIAKLNLWLELHADNTGTMTDLPRAAMTEAVAMLGNAA